MALTSYPTSQACVTISLRGSCAVWCLADNVVRSRTEWANAIVISSRNYRSGLILLQVPPSL